MSHYCLVVSARFGLGRAPGAGPARPAIAPALSFVSAPGLSFSLWFVVCCPARHAYGGSLPPKAVALRRPLCRASALRSVPRFVGRPFPLAGVAPVAPGGRSAAPSGVRASCVRHALAGRPVARISFYARRCPAVPLRAPASVGRSRSRGAPPAGLVPPGRGGAGAPRIPPPAARFARRLAFVIIKSFLCCIRRPQMLWGCLGDTWGQYI